jgi:uncharacterized membrane protein
MPYSTGGSLRFRRALTVVLCGVALAVLFVLIPAGGAAPALATTLTTPYPAMTVQAGQIVTIDLSVSDSAAQRLDLSIEGVPSGWKATIMGGGRPVSAVMTDPGAPSSLQLQVEVPADAEESTSTLTVVTRSASASTLLPISLTVSKVEGGTTELTAEYSSLRGPAAATYTFSLTLANKTLEARTYNLSASGPENWTLSLKPSGASQETPTVSVESQGAQGLTLEVTPASDVEIGSYDLTVTAVGGGETVSVPLQIEITGTYTLTLTTPDSNLNADVKAGGTTRVQFVVTNSGTGPLQGVKLYASAPANWDVTFEPSTIDTLPANQQETVTAVFTPAKNAIAGDYVVTMHASADQASAQSDIRVTVKTSTLWGVVGVLIAVAAIAILGFVFRRYGHR